MSEYTPTTDEAFNATLYTWVDWKGTFASEEEAADAWTRMIAEVERAAAEKAWDEGEIAGYEDALAEQRGIESHEYTSNPYSKSKEVHDDQS